jgi:hypothetical protein
MDMNPFRILVPAAGLLLVPVLAVPAHAQATRTWVSGVGDDANPCSRTAPCKTFAGAITKTAVGGEINAIDGAGFGAVTITKSITIDLTGVEGGVLAIGTNGIVIDAGATADVTLRGLDILGSSATDGSCGGLTGIKIVQARSVRLDNLKISGFNVGLDTPLTDASPDIYVDMAMSGLQVTDNCQYGVRLAPDSGKAGRATITGSFLTQSNTALSVAHGAEAWVSNSHLNHNNTGIQLAGGTAHQGCNVEVAANATDGAFSDYACGPTVVKPTAAPVVYCKVPRLTGRTLAQATQSLKAAHCAVGPVKRKKASAKKRGRVLTQNVPAGIEAKKGTRVALVIGRK